MYLKALSVICWRVKVLDSWLWHKISVMLFPGTGACDVEVFLSFIMSVKKCFVLLDLMSFLKWGNQAYVKYLRVFCFQCFWYDMINQDATWQYIQCYVVTLHPITLRTRQNGSSLQAMDFLEKKSLQLDSNWWSLFPKNPIKNGSALVLMGRGRAWGWWFWMCSLLPTERNIFKMADEISQDITAFQLVTIQAEAIQISGMNHWWSLPADELAG